MEFSETSTEKVYFVAVTNCILADTRRDSFSRKDGICMHANIG